MSLRSNCNHSLPCDGVTLRRSFCSPRKGTSRQADRAAAVPLDCWGLTALLFIAVI